MPAHSQVIWQNREILQLKRRKRKKSPVNYLSHLSVLVKWKQQWLLFPYQMLPAKSRGQLSAVSLFKVTGGTESAYRYCRAQSSFWLKAALLCWHCGLSEEKEEWGGRKVFAHPSRARKCEMQCRFWWVTWLQRERYVNYSVTMQQ